MYSITAENFCAFCDIDIKSGEEQLLHRKMGHQLFFRSDEAEQGPPNGGPVSIQDESVAHTNSNRSASQAIPDFDQAASNGAMVCAGCGNLYHIFLLKSQAPLIKGDSHGN